MAARSEWIWGTLTPAQLDVAAELARVWLRNVQTRGLAQTRHAHTPDKQYQNIIGAQGEVAREVRMWGAALPRASWVVAQAHLQPWRSATLQQGALF